MHKNNFRRQRKLENRLGETVRIASIVQKGMTTGRSSYVEMRALGRLTNHNIKSKVHSLNSMLLLLPKGGEDHHQQQQQQRQSYDELVELLSKVPGAVGDGYTHVLTPNGIVREKELDRLLSADSDIVTCLAIIEQELRKSQKVAKASVTTLKELLDERKRLTDTIRA